MWHQWHQMMSQCQSCLPESIHWHTRRPTLFCLFSQVWWHRPKHTCCYHGGNVVSQLSTYWRSYEWFKLPVLLDTSRVLSSVLYYCRQVQPQCMRARVRACARARVRACADDDDEIILGIIALVVVKAEWWSTYSITQIGNPRVKNLNFLCASIYFLYILNFWPHKTPPNAPLFCTSKTPRSTFYIFSQDHDTSQKNWLLERWHPETRKCRPKCPNWPSDWSCNWSNFFSHLA